MAGGQSPRHHCCRLAQHRAPITLAPSIIQSGAKASSDMLRRSSRRGQCGGKSATIHIPGWVGLQTSVNGWPGALAEAVAGASGACLGSRSRNMLEEIFERPKIAALLLEDSLTDVARLGQVAALVFRHSAL